jgi:hypothetical protein
MSSSSTRVAYRWLVATRVEKFDWKGDISYSLVLPLGKFRNHFNFGFWAAIPNVLRAFDMVEKAAGSPGHLYVNGKAARVRAHEKPGRTAARENLSPPTKSSTYIHLARGGSGLRCNVSVAEPVVGFQIDRKTVVAQHARVKSAGDRIAASAKSAGLGRVFHNEALAWKRDKIAVTSDFLFVGDLDKFIAWHDALPVKPVIDNFDDIIPSLLEDRRVQEEESRIREEKARAREIVEQVRKNEYDARQKAELAAIGFTGWEFVERGNGPWSSSTKMTYLATGTGSEKDLEAWVNKRQGPHGMKIRRKGQDAFLVEIWWDTSD